MVAPVFDKIRIQNALIAAAQGGTFYVQKTDTNTKLLSCDGSTVAPAEVLCEEIRATFGLDPLNRRHMVRSHVTWVFELMVKFDVPVTAEVFEEKLLNSPITLQSDAGQVSRYASIRLDMTIKQSNYPVQQQPSGGSRFIYTFQAIVRPA